MLGRSQKFDAVLKPEAVSVDGCQTAGMPAACTIRRRVAPASTTGACSAASFSVKC